MTRLRKMMLEELERRNYSEATTRCYILCLPKIPFSGFHQCNIVTLRSKLATISIRQGQVQATRCDGLSRTLTDTRSHDVNASGFTCDVRTPRIPKP